MLNLRTLFSSIAVAACGLAALILFLGTTARTAHAVPRTGAATAPLDASGDDSTTVEPPAILANGSTAAGDYFAFQASVDTTGTTPFAVSALEAVPSGSRPADTPGLLFEPGDVEVRLNGMSITGTGSGFINHPSLPSKQLEVRYSTDFVLAEEPFRVRTGEATFVDGSEEVASLDRDGLHFQIPSEEPRPMLATAQCEMSVPNDQSPASRAAADFEDETVSIGGFPLTIDAASGSAEELSGTGHVDVPYLDAPLAVSFSNLSVNDARTVYAGTVTATQEEQAGALESGLLDDYTASIKELAGTHAADISAAIASGNRMAAQLTGGSPVGLPFGIAPSGGGSSSTLAIVGAQFAPTGSRVKTLLQVPMPGVGETLSLGAADVCLNADGIGGEFALRLPEDHTFTTAGGKVTHRFTAAGQAPSGDVPDSGTYAMWRNDALGDLSAELDLEYSRQWLIPQNDQGQDAGGKAVASFSITTAAADGLGDFIAKGTLQRSELAAAPGFTVPETEVYYDNSSVKNADGMSFPDGYRGLTSSLWTGVSVSGSFSMALPAAVRTLEDPNQRVEAPLNGTFLIDNQGVNLEAGAQDLFAIGEGDLGGWGYGIDDFAVTVEKNSLVDSKMTGGVLLPVLEEGIPYNATITTSSSGDLDFTFLLGTEDGAVYHSKLWASQILLREGSNISIDYTGGEFTAEATLHGELGIIGKTPEVDVQVPEQTLSTPKIDVDAAGQSVGVSSQSITLPEQGFTVAEQTVKLVKIPFEGFTLRNQGPDYVTAGTWSKADSDLNYNQIGGFPIKIHEISVVEKGQTAEALTLGLRFKQVGLFLPGMEQTQMFTASTSFTLNSTITSPSPGQLATTTYEGGQLDNVKLVGGVGSAFHLDGKLIFFNKGTEFGKEYGDGLAGSVNATVMKWFNANVEFILGEKEGTKYWFFQAGVFTQAGLTVPGTTIFGRLNVHGFRGGAYYHMEPPQEWTDKAINFIPENAPRRTGQPFPAPDPPDAELAYEVDPSVTAGFRAGVTLSYGSPQILSGDVNLDMAFNNGTGVEQVTLNGKAFFLSKGRMRNKITERESSAQGIVDVSLAYDVPEKTFHGVLDARIQPANGFVEASGKSTLHVDGEDEEYYFQVGDPAGTWFQVPALGGFVKGELFLYVGNTPPARVKPVDAYCNASEFAFDETSPLCKGNFQPSPPSSNAGFLLGLGVSASFGGQVAIFYGALDAGLGASLNLQKVGRATCIGSGYAPGSNGFYARGQVFAGIYGEVGIVLDIPAIYTGRLPIAAIGVATELTAGFPNPTWAKGDVAGRYSVLGGLVEGDFHYDFETGDVCELGGSGALADIEAIQDVAPKDRADDASVFAQPSATFSMNLDEPQTVDGPNGETQVRLSTDGITMYEGSSTNGQVVAGTSEQKNEGSLLVFSPDGALKGNTEYTFTVNAYAEEKSAAGRWTGATDEDGNLVPHATRTVTFTTGPRPTTIQDEHVSHTAPLDRKRYYVRGSRSSNGIHFKRGNIDYSYLGDLTEEERKNDDIRGVYLRVRYSEINALSSFSTPRITAKGGSITWDQPSLDPSTIYSVQLVRVKQLSGEAYMNEFMNMLETMDSRRNVEVGSGTASVRERKIKGVTTAVPGEKVIYNYHFRTSRYRTYDDKFGDVRARSGGYDSGSYAVEVYHPREPFDKYDLAFGRGDGKPLIQISGARPEAHSSYTTGSYVREYVRPYIRDFPRSWFYRIAYGGIEYENQGLTIGPNLLVAAFSGNFSEYGAPLLRRSELLPGGYRYNSNWRDFTIGWTLPRYAIAEHKDIKQYLRFKSSINRGKALNYNNYLLETYSWWGLGDWLTRMNEILSAPVSEYLHDPSLHRFWTEPYSYTKGGKAYLRLDARWTSGDDWFTFGF